MYNILSDEYRNLKKVSENGMDRLDEFLRQIMTEPKIFIPKKRLAEFCQKNYIMKLSLFGSVLSDSFGPNSDIDVLVEFDPAHVPGLAFIRLQSELSQIFGGRKVDLVTPKFLNRRIRAQVEAEARVQYAQE